MGALHEGHMSLIELAQAHSDKVIVSIYVNPTQFAAHEDYGVYPRGVENDVRCVAASARLLCLKIMPLDRLISSFNASSNVQY